MNERRIFRVTMLGGFELRYNEEPVRLKKRRSTKPLQLLQLLLYYREKWISRQTLIDELYGPETDIDTANNLNVTVSQLRRLLRDSGLPRGEYIQTNMDGYRFQSPFPIWVDTEEMLALRKEALSTEGEERRELLGRICALYRGRFLPELDGESWVETARGYFHKIYGESMEELCRMLWDAGDYQTLLHLTKHASKIFPFDEWQTWQYDCLQAQGRLREAQELYRKTEKLYRSELGIPLPERMRKQIETPMDAEWEVRSVRSIRDRLDKARQEGPYCLAFPSFLDAYNLISRMGEIAKQPICLMLCTLRGGSSRTEREREILGGGMERLETVLRTALRQEDIFTRYSRRQYLVILAGVEEKDCNVISERMTGLFQAEGQSLTLECQSVSSENVHMSIKEKP